MNNKDADQTAHSRSLICIFVVRICGKTGFLMMWLIYFSLPKYEPRHDKTNKLNVRPAMTRISLGIRPVWSESLLSAWRKLGLLATHWAHIKDSDQTGRMPRLIWVLAGRTVILLILSRGGSYFFLVFVYSKRVPTMDITDPCTGKERV